MGWLSPDWTAKELTEESAKDIAHWTGGVLVEEIHPETGARTVGLNFPGKDAVMRASEGDYVAQMKDGSFQRWSARHFQSKIEELL